MSFLAESFNLFSNNQMRAHVRRFIELILKLFTKQIHIIWNQSKNKIISLLNLNIVNAFLTISYEKLIYNLKIKKISKWIIDWFHNFFKNRTITLTINNQIINFFSISIELSQNSMLFFILYFFYNAELLKKMQSIEKKNNNSKIRKRR